MSRLLVIGGGGFGRAVAEVAIASPEQIMVGFVDDRWPHLPPIWNLPVLGRLADLSALRSIADAVVLAIGDNIARQSAFQIALDAGFEFATIVHPRATISPSARLGRAVSVMAGAIIGTEAHIDDGAIVNAGAVVDHHVHVGRFSHVSIGACVGGGAVIEPHAWLRGGHTLPPGHRLAADATSSAAGG